jgi:periplasmic protein TonB
LAAVSRKLLSLHPLSTLSRCYQRAASEQRTAMSEKRFLLYFCVPAVGVILICSTVLLFRLTASTGNFPKLPVEPPKVVSVNSAQLSIHAKSVDSNRGRADLMTPRTLPSSELSGPDYIASILEQAQTLEEPADEVSEPVPSLPGTDPASSKDASSLSAAASETKVAGPSRREETVASESHDKPPSKAMALVRSEKPSSLLLKATIPQENVGDYGAKVRAFLARQPRAVGPAGSAIVTFAISAGGTLRYARISHSSDNTALDEMALATVRNAAPFPPPPKAMNAEAVSYSIQIGFQEPR